ncbi:hypothetical protein BZA70DRAFT_167934 [Myxozyma melibiosi]|uniref:Uncharacterized protein n=1 Tax=Myxozyma melibiosi TaxID=54550 RepID=A0ABR1F580_9ASCO
MRTIQFCVLLLAALFACVVSAAPERDSTYMDKLLKSSSINPGLIRLTDKNFGDVISAPRDYAVVVLLTAESPSMGCQLCRQFAPDYHLVAQSWSKEHPKSGDGLYFAVLDFVDGQRTFQSLGLKTAPNVWLYGPTVGENAGPAAPIVYEIHGVVDMPGSVARFIESHVPGVGITIYKPRDYSKIGQAVTGLVAIGLFIRYLYPILKPFFESRTLWAGISLVAILMFTSGHMFNNIRHTPYVAGNKEGGVSYVAPGFQQQYGFETQVVAVLYAFLAFGAISLSIKTPRIKDSTRQLLSVLTWATIIWCLFSALMFVFRMKNPGYPLSLPPMTK